MVQACLLLCALSPWVARAAPPADLAPPQQVIEQVSAGLKRVLRDDRERLAHDRAFVRRVVDALFMPHLDLDGLTRLVLGPHGRDATPAQQAAFIEAFKTLVINTYSGAVSEIGPWEIRYLPLRPSADPRRVTVPTEVLRPRGPPVAVSYRMVERDGRWLTYDAVVEEVSLLASYRDAFGRVARARGLDGLISEIERRNATAAGALAAD